MNSRRNLNLTLQSSRRTPRNLGSTGQLISVCKQFGNFIYKSIILSVILEHIQFPNQNKLFQYSDLQFQNL